MVSMSLTIYIVVDDMGWGERMVEMHENENKNELRRSNKAAYKREMKFDNSLGAAVLLNTASSP